MYASHMMGATLFVHLCKRSKHCLKLISLWTVLTLGYYVWMLHVRGVIYSEQGYSVWTMQTNVNTITTDEGISITTHDSTSFPQKLSRHQNMLPSNTSLNNTGPFFRQFADRINCIDVMQRRDPHNPVPNELEYYCDMASWCHKEVSDTYTHIDDLCPCFPDNVIGERYPDIGWLSSLQWQYLSENLGLVLGSGGHWKPNTCIPRRKVAIIIPYRDRERHLRIYLGHVVPILQDQLIEFRIFVIEQNEPFTFNKASLMNIGIVESQKVFAPDCYLFHDVDTLPERDDNMIICGDHPVHWAAYNDRTEYAYISTHFGGAVLFTKAQLLNINGFSNIFFGWGGEDDDLLFRTRSKKQRIYVGPRSVARFTIIQHIRDTAFAENKQRWPLVKASEKKPKLHSAEGLNNVNYAIKENVNKPLYTWIKADLKAPDIREMRKISRSTHSAVSRRIRKAFAPSEEFVVVTFKCEQGFTNDSRLYKSKITCRDICVKTKSLAFQYYEGTNMDNYCIFLSRKCVLLQNEQNSSLNVELHIRKKYISSFSLPSSTTTTTTTTNRHL